MNARAKLANAGKFDKESAAACGEQESKKLKARRKDFALMTGNISWKAPEGAFHKPGSQK